MTEVQWLDKIKKNEEYYYTNYNITLTQYNAILRQNPLLEINWANYMQVNVPIRLYNINPGYNMTAQLTYEEENE